jgi:hypothetical protein
MFNAPPYRSVSEASVPADDKTSAASPTVSGSTSVGVDVSVAVEARAEADVRDDSAPLVAFPTVLINMRRVRIRYAADEAKSRRPAPFIPPA